MYCRNYGLQKPLTVDVLIILWICGFKLTQELSIQEPHLLTVSEELSFPPGVWS